MVNDSSLHPTRPFIRHTVFRGNRSELLQGCNHIADDSIRAAYTIIMGKLDGVVTSDIPKLCPDIHAVIFVGQETSIIYDISNIVGRL